MFNPKMTTLSPAPLAAIRSIAANVAAKHAEDVDRNARFPAESVAALREAKLLSAAVPVELGGLGCTLRELAEMCAALSHACASSAMVLAMHHIQVGCIARHALRSSFFRAYLRELVEHQYLLASMTSEVGTSGDTRSSICAVQVDGDRFALNKDATTGSYCAHADAILVTCRRATDSPANDQVLVLVRNSDYRLTQTTSWDTLGMRGTSSPGFKLESSGGVEQIVPGGYGECSAQTMVPYSHILWASLWWGIAADAMARGAAFVRADARRKPGTVPASASRLAETAVQLQTMRHHWMGLADEFDTMSERAEGMNEMLAIGWALKMNHLKVAASTAAPQIVHQALQVVGVMGYKNDSPFSVGRHYRDSLSASLMVSNDRVTSNSASMLLIFKDS